MSDRSKSALHKALRSKGQIGDRLLMGFETEHRPARVGFHNHHPEPAPNEETPVWLEGEGHLITIATTGAGKGRGGLIPNLLSYEGPAIVIDPKGEAYAVTARRRMEMGQKVHVIDPFKVVTEHGDSLNPFDAFDVVGVDPSSQAMDLAKQLSGGTASLKDPFWDIRGHDLLAGVISAVASTALPADRNFGKVRKYLKSDDVTYNLAVLLDTVGGKLHRFAYEEIASFLQIADLTRSGILATACSYISVLGSDAAQRTMMTSTIDINAVRKGAPMTIYLVVPPHKLASHASLFRLWTSVLMAAVMSRTGPAPKLRTLFAIDECAQIGDFGMLPMVYTLARAYGMRVWAFFQDLAQIKRIMPNEWQTVLTNSAAIQVFGVPNHLMASELAQILGDFPAEELRQMPRDKLALQQAGVKGRLVRRPDYLNDPEFEELYAPHPVYAKPAGGKRRPRPAPQPEAKSDRPDKAKKPDKPE
jgi:type IV secretion system protein VirD4